jgi:N4-(beta-N-acetylglucosaminyl)-L-asparaginase
MNGNGDCGGVSFLERIKHPVSVARAVMEKTPHVLLSGEGAQLFAVANGFKLESGELSNDAKKQWAEWLKKSEYKPQINIERHMPGMSQFAPFYFDDGKPNHDTMGTVALDAAGGLAGMVTTSGMAFKMRGRVGDSPIIGAGLYVDARVGGAAATGVGEEVIKVAGSYAVVDAMGRGATPEAAITEVLRKLEHRRGNRDTDVSFVALRADGEAAGVSLRAETNFKYALIDPKSARVITSKVLPAR